MLPFKKCPVCGGERLYSEETVRRFEEIRKKLERKDTKEFEAVGQSFFVK
jgi:hypothetical protein